MTSCLFPSYKPLESTFSRVDLKLRNIIRTVHRGLFSSRPSEKINQNDEVTLLLFFIKQQKYSADRPIIS